MNKKYFDLGHNKFSRFSFDEWFGWKPKCKADWLYCYNNHVPWECERKRILEEFMWTRRR